MRVSVPGADSPRRLFSFGRDLNALNPSDYYEFDFQHVQFVTPGWLVSVGTALRRFRAGKIKRRAINYRHLGYAAHVGFFKYFGMSYGLAPSEAAGTINYVPITEVDVVSIRERAAKTYVHAGEIIEDEARQLAKLLTRNEGGPVVDTLTYSIREIVRNVIEHSRSPTPHHRCSILARQPIGRAGYFGRWLRDHVFPSGESKASDRDGSHSLEACNASRHLIQSVATGKQVGRMGK